ncbi:nitrate/nitrite transporter [Streptomonospora nanhaiensis]|uniref:Sugar phosphate permease n=1 Tax=Streptomonospora nanhaiensis TaxID=1323731 RepID=A0A853BW64_9ACTN|nr:MFS transporter [Streptomonospora nanhaiensis]MBV2365420.1 MFS transporter [Streptomonospora nanhaiensis]MBX9390838.1 MFS transporter [Streptomonospora nanhaiensis]NYI98985.1 sugar phosphate permease [Streptomonospora nanhaiensis]
MTAPHSAPATAAKAPAYRWVILILAWLAFTMTSVDRSTWGPASASVGEALGVSMAGLGVFATGYYIGYVISNAGGGFLTDWLGGRTILSASLFAAGVFMVCFGSSTSAAMGIAFQAVIGLFAGADYSAGVKLISTWFSERDRGMAMGVFMTATSLGTVVANTVVPRLIQWHDWQTSYHFFGGVSIAVAVACYVLVRNGDTGPAAARGRSAALPDLRPMARNRDLLLLGLAGFGGLWGTYGFITWSNTLMVDGNGVDPVTAGTVVAVFAFTAVIGKPLIGLVTDLIGKGRRLPTVVVLAFFSATLLVFGAMDSATAFLWVAPFLGLGAYIYSPLMVTMIPNVAGRALAGSAAGATNAVWQLGSVIVPVVVGAVYQHTGSFYAAFVTLAVGPLVGAAVMLLVREQAPANADARAGAGADTARAART